MKQVLQNRRGLIVVRDVPAPHCPPGALVVRNAFSAISSGTERAGLTHSQKSLLERARERPDLVREVARRALSEGLRETRSAVNRKLDEESAVGYSSAGRVIRVGSAVRGFSPGDAVACAGAGFANHAEIVTVPANLCARVPDGVALDRASLTTIAAIALHGIRLARVDLGSHVGVIGCGLVGQIACRLLRVAGAQVYAIDVDPGRVADAVDGGADHGFTTGDQPAQKVLGTVPAGLDAVIITAASAANDPLLLAADIARDRGSVVLVGDVPIEIPRAPLYLKELEFRVSRSYGPGRYDRDYEEHGIDYPLGYVRWTQQRNMECVLALQARGLLDLGSLIHTVMPVHEAARAYSLLAGDVEERPRGALLLSYPEAAEERAESAASTPRRPRPATATPRIGLIGPGDFAKSVLVPALVEAGARLEVVGGGSGPSAAAAVRDLGFARFAADEAAVIDDPEVDAVVIATRHASHADLAARALDAGKHVFCEKPLAIDEQSLARVIDAARRSERVLMVGYNRRFSPLLRELRTFVGDGELIANYRVSAGKVPASSWVHDLDDGGGRILGEACHFLDTLVYLAAAEITTVSAAAARDEDLPLQALDNVVVTATLSDGSVGTVAYVSSGSAGVGKERLEVFADAKTAILDDYRSLELHGGEAGRKRESRQDKGHREELRAFVGAVAGGCAPPIEVDELENVSLAGLAAIESLRAGATVTVSR